MRNNHKRQYDRGRVIIPLQKIQSLQGVAEYRFGFIIDHHVDYHYKIRRVNGVYLLYSTHWGCSDQLREAATSIIDIRDYLDRHHGYSIDFILKEKIHSLSEIADTM